MHKGGAKNKRNKNTKKDMAHKKSKRLGGLYLVQSASNKTNPFVFRIRGRGHLD